MSSRVRSMSGSPSCFKFALKFQNTIFSNLNQHILELAQTVKKWWIFALVFYFLCIKDFIDIYIYSTLKITKRTMWMLQTLGVFQTTDINSSVSRLNKITQTDMKRKKDTQSSPFEHPRTKKLHSSSQTSPPCKLKLSFSPPKIKVKKDETKFEEMSQKFPIKNPETSPAVLKLEAEIPREDPFPTTTYSQTPLCNINLSVSPTVQPRIKETNNLSPEERNFLKRKWHNWKLKQYIRKMKTHSTLLNYQDNYDGVFACPENTTYSEWSPDDYNKKLFADEVKLFPDESVIPNMQGCCGSWVTKLKTKFQPSNDGPAVTFKRF